jgi:serine/threonine protein kinase
VTFEDRLGTRFEAVSPEGDPVEVLELKEQFANVPSFEFSLRKRVNTLTAFRDPSCATVRGVRLGGGLAVVSDRVRGTRLSKVLEAYERDLLPVEFNAAVCILRQLVPAVAILHETMPDVCHGTIAPERIVITPEGRVVIVEHTLASALESLRYSDQQYWDELRIAVPKTAGPSCFDQRSDVLQIGLVALALIHGRSLNLEEYPVPTASLSERAWAATASGGLEPLPSALRMWLNRTLQLEPKQAFNTASAVWSELKHALPQSNSAELPALKAALARYGFDSLPALPTPVKGSMASAAGGSAAVAPAHPPTPAPRAAAPAPVTPAPQPMTPAPKAEGPEPVSQPVVTPKPAAARPVDPVPAAMPTPVRMPIAAQTPLRTPVAASNPTPVPTPTPRPTPVPAARMQPSPVAAPTPAPSKPSYVPASVTSGTSGTSQSDSGPIARSVRANVHRDVSASQPAAPKASEDSTTIRTPRPSNPISASSTSAVDRPFEAHVPAAAAPEPAYKFAVQDEEENNMTYNTPPWWRRRSTAAAVFVILAAGVGVAGRSLFSPSADAAVPGTLVVETNPAGVAVVLDGKRSGQTPVRLEVSAGSHVLTLLTEPTARTIPVTIAAGATVSQYVEVPKVVAETGQLQIRTEPSGARVVVDGTSRGSAPVTVENLMPGSHTVEVSNENGSVRQEITIAAGTTSSLVVPMQSAPQGALSGYISVAAPVDVQIYEDVRLVGSSRSDRLMVSVGRHELDIVNETLGFRTRRVVNVTPGQVSSIKLDWPNGSMAINAQPWAEVFIDGERVGETPIGNVPVPIGTHEVRFRHPELGEQVVRSTVTLGSPARLSVDLRKK